jgi:hypothetical protein
VKSVLAAFLIALTSLPAFAGTPIEIDHVLIYVSPGAPERAALEKAGFVIAPDVNHHTGQGTSSVTVEFANGYLELLYPDPGVAVSPGMEPVAQLFRDRSNWQKTGMSPFGLQFHRTPLTPASFPFPTVKVHSDWMAPGENLELLTPRAMTSAVGLFIAPEPVDQAANAALAVDPVKGARFRHANGAQRITGVEVDAPSAASLPPAANYISDNGVAKIAIGPKWLMILTLDDGKQGKVRDLNPDLPLIIHY